MKGKVTIYLNERKDSKILAYASLTLDEIFVVTGIKLIKGKNGKFITFPQYKTKDEDYRDVCFPLNKELRDDITDLVIVEYNKKVKEDDEGKKGKKGKGLS